MTGELRRPKWRGPSFAVFFLVLGPLFAPPPPPASPQPDAIPCDTPGPNVVSFHTPSVHHGPSLPATPPVLLFVSVCVCVTGHVAAHSPPPPLHIRTPSVIGIFLELS
jgi:hypothetical protein